MHAQFGGSCVLHGFYNVSTFGRNLILLSVLFASDLRLLCQLRHSLGSHAYAMLW